MIIMFLLSVFHLFGGLNKSVSFQFYPDRPTPAKFLLQLSQLNQSP